MSHFKRKDREVLDWDFYAVPPKPQRSGTIKVRLVHEPKLGDFIVLDDPHVVNNHDPIQQEENIRWFNDE